MEDPARAERLWFAIAVATLWVVALGGETETSLTPSSLDDLPPRHVARTRSTRRSRPRLLSCFRAGLLRLLAHLLLGQPLTQARFVPEPWPTALHSC
ncbi:MAG TPA: hypothetical protein DEP84_31230 [Chloroflexi bacterium]|nr:hypothetical protein [Chloroflexota bacterium]